MSASPSPQSETSAASVPASSRPASLGNSRPTGGFFAYTNWDAFPALCGVLNFALVVVMPRFHLLGQHRVEHQQRLP